MGLIEDLVVDVFLHVASVVTVWVSQLFCLINPLHSNA